jgi:hypothetical protein
MVLAPVLGAACALWMSGTLPPSQPFSPIGALGWALQCIFVSWIVAAGMIEATVRDFRLAVARSLPAIWVAPAYVLLRAQSEWAIVAVALFAWSLTVNLRREAGERPEPPRHFAVAMVCGFGVQTAALVAGAGHVLVGSMLAATVAAAVAWRLEPSPWQRRVLPLAVAACAAVLLTRASLSSYVAASPEDIGQRARRIRIPKPEEPKPGPSVELGSVFESVILWPETDTKTALVPPLPALRSSLATPRRLETLSIPFYGAYWFLQMQHKQPPPDAVIVRGRADERTFRNTSLRPITMEAHQNLGTLLPLSCCGRIDLAIRNADSSPGSVMIELLLSNTVNGPRTLSLGLQPVLTTLGWKPSPGVEPRPEVLHFQVPSKPSLADFDQFSVRFHLSPVRAYRAARIGIERFVLVPRGS